MPHLLTLTTDFGLADGYVAALKGVILRLHPHLTLVDITHEVPPQDVLEAAFVLRQALPYFPDETVHLVVVDPGVGTERRPLAARFAPAPETPGLHTFVGPDNGLLTLLAAPNPPTEVVTLDQPRFWRTPTPTATFHGRDLFGPVAAHLATGVPLATVGTPVRDYERLHWGLPQADAVSIRGWIQHIDRYGNCITNIGAEMLPRDGTPRPLRCFTGTTRLAGLHRTYADVEIGEVVALVGSSGFLEIGVNQGHAADLLGLRKGSPITVSFD